MPGFVCMITAIMAVRIRRPQVQQINKYIASKGEEME